MSPSRHPRLLVSVGSVAEALLALEAGAELIDAKDPAAGALGALSPAEIGDIARAIGPRATVTAVIGDHLDADQAIDAARRVADTGVDMVKIGLFPDVDRAALIAALGAHFAARTRLVAVLLADRDPDPALVPLIAAAGFAGVMLDTAGKSGGLTALMSLAELQRFVGHAHENGLMAGLAGSLRLADVPVLAPLGADLLGFRGGLCEDGVRTRALVPGRIAAVAAALARAGAMAPA